MCTEFTQRLVFRWYNINTSVLKHHVQALSRGQVRKVTALIFKSGACLVLVWFLEITFVQLSTCLCLLCAHPQGY